jgi:hypothetical protein
MRPTKATLRTALLFLFLGSLGLIVFGFTLPAERSTEANKYIGFGTVAIFLITMPLFLLLESRNKRMKDYLLNEENILKMRENEEKKVKKSQKTVK